MSRKTRRLPKTVQEALIPFSAVFAKALSFRHWEYNVKHRYRPLDGIEAWSLDQMAHDAARADAYWTMAVGIALQLEALGPKQRQSPTATAMRQAKEEATLLMNRYDALFFEELRFLTVRRAKKNATDAEPQPFCATMQVSI
jgi:hypothetical protein